MSLQLYAKKRNFKCTPEPKGGRTNPGKQLEFVVQRHQASRLHYDFRLEMEGVMKSWAVPKGPSMNPSHKRLAVMVEDHPYDYRTFEGSIPKGNYGAGTVEIWDKGFYSTLNPAGNPERELLKALKQGSLKFVLKGKKLKGEFALVRLKNDSKQKNAWLLIKHRDRYSVDDNYSSEDYPPMKKLKGSTSIPSNSKVGKRTKSQVKELKQAVSEKPVRVAGISKEKHLTDYVKPMLAKQVAQPFDNKDWIFEIKWDGYRAIAETGKTIKFYSRNGISFLDQFPVITEALREIKYSLILDGEIVAFNNEGKPDFQLLQHYDPEQSKLAYYIFDILNKEGKDLTGFALTERKAILQKTLKQNVHLRYSDHVVGTGIRMFHQIEKMKLEGLIAKKGSSSYTKGKRSGDWLKVKIQLGKEVVIAGFTQPRGSRKYFGALVLGIYNGKVLEYVGHAGTGFTDETLLEVYNRLKPLINRTSPFKEKIITNMPVTWVKPKVVCNVKFSNWTDDSSMRHPVFMGLRFDKEAHEVIREEISTLSQLDANGMQRKNENRSLMKKGTPDKSPENIGSHQIEDSKQLKLDGRKVPLTNLNKFYFPADKISKAEIIAYYQSVSTILLPYLKNRPQSLLRNPNGILDKGFYQKDAGDTVPNWVKSKKIFSESANKDIKYIICNDKSTLAYLNNLGCIELNPWHSRTVSLDRPDYLAIDIDPSPSNTFEQVIETAKVVKEIFDRIGAACYCKTSGATGLHVYVPMGAKYTYNEVKDFANLVAIMVTESLPEFTSVIRPLQKRGNKIYVDFLQNRRGQTLASVYSIRPREGATVSTPLQWKEVKNGLHPSQFDIFTVPKRLKKTGDIFSKILGKGVSLEKCLKGISNYS